MRAALTELPPILQIHEPAQVREHLQASPVWPLLAAEGLTIDWAAQFFAPHAVVAAALAGLADPHAPMCPERVLLVGNANHASLASLFRAPAALAPLIGYWMGSAQPWPAVRLLSHQMPWPGPILPLPQALRQGEEHVRIGRLRDPDVLWGIDRVLLLPSTDLVVDFALGSTAEALQAAHRKGVIVSGVCATLTEAWVLREQFRLHGLLISAPQPTHLQVYSPGAAVPRPAFYTWTLRGLAPPANRADQARLIQLHAWLQDGADGYTDDALWVGTPDPEDNYVHLLGGYCLSLEDGYVYQPRAAADAAIERFVRVAGPVPRDLQSHPPQHSTEPIERWYWALGLVQAFSGDVETAAP